MCLQRTEIPAPNKRNRCTTDFTGFKTCVLLNLQSGSRESRHFQCCTSNTGGLYSGFFLCFYAGMSFLVCFGGYRGL